MIRVWELDAALAVVFFILIVPVALAPFLHRIYGVYGRFAGGPAVLAMSAGLYGCALVAFTLFPLPDPDTLSCSRGSLIEYWQLDPLASINEIGTRASAEGVTAVITSGPFLQVLMNILFFVPLGVLARYRAGFGLGRTLAAGFIVSLAIELTQGTGLWGLYPCPYRLLAIDDLIWNTVGAGAGWLLGTVVGRLVPFVQPDPSPDTGAPTMRRRVGATIGDIVVVTLAQLLVAIVVLLPLMAAGVALSDAQLVASVATLVVASITLGLVPAIRRDRATPGAWATWLGAATAGTDHPASRTSVLVAFGVRWLPALVTGLAFVLPLTLLLEAATVLARRDRRTLSSVIAGTVTITRRSMALLPQERQVDP